MTVSEFLELFIRELEISPELRPYYRLINSNDKFLWRKAYLEQRLNYVSRQIHEPGSLIWDVGCGYATTAIFLVLNGHNVHGNTLEFYYDKIKKRLEYWSRFGNLDNLSVEYANLFDMPVAKNHYDAVIAQDTLHHLEPIGEALNILGQSLKTNGKLVVTEENGSSVFIAFKNFSQRGFKKINEYYDEHLQKTILFGNENARSLKAWEKLLNQTGYEVSKKETEYVRLLPHFFYNENNYAHLHDKEALAGKKLPFLREFLFFGINFTAFHKFNHTES